MPPSHDILKTLSEFTIDNKKQPPVELWNPDFCGEIDIEIKANGQWLHDGKPITRRKLVTLFSSVLIKEESQYFLITPVEKLAIKVEWQPFVIIDFEIHRGDNLGKNDTLFVMQDNCNHKIPLNKTGQLKMSHFQGLSLPVIKVRRNLYAAFSRSCYYRLIEQAKQVKRNQKDHLQITSAGINFSLGEID